jgi:hypothetical protein
MKSERQANKFCFFAQNESVLIQKIYTHFKKAPGTHKLGVLYVVDSVTRQWVEAARKAGQPSGSAAPDGTFAAGVNRVTELLPVLMTDIIINAPEDQKVRSRRNMQTTIKSPPSLRACVRSIRSGDLCPNPAVACIRLDLRISCYIPPVSCIEFAVPFLGFYSVVLWRIVQLTYPMVSTYRKKSGSWLIFGNVDILSLPPCLPHSKKN